MNLLKFELLEFFFWKLGEEFWNFKTLDGILLIRYAAIKIALPHKHLGTLVENSNDLTTSKRCLFIFSTMSVYWEISTQELWWIIPFSRKTYP